MSSDWAWDQVDKISNDPNTNGLTFVPVILGSDKTTVLVATGTNDYYPLYILIRNVCNNVRHAHYNAVAIIGFLAMPKMCSWSPRCMSHHKDLDAESLHHNCDHTEALVEELLSTNLWDKYGIINDLVISHPSTCRTAFNI
ncbi:hypothetical protein BDR06DRAFT_968109 [Suillus hirtellus]|nr:hypothetical protein BDR06DRAFT_968109 [Suillus hirtellus]